MKRIFVVFRAKWPEYILEMLVLILGIYGAFFLERWNERRTTNAFAEATLQRILVNLKTDRKMLDSIHHNFQSAIVSTEKMLAFDRKKQNTDSLQYWLGNIARFDRFLPLTNSYEVLKSRGLDILPNEELAYQIGKYYDTDAPNVTKGVADIETSFVNDWIPFLKSNDVEFEFGRRLDVHDWKFAFDDGSMLRIVKLNRDNYSSGAAQLAIIIRNLDELINLVEKELYFRE